MKRPLSLALLLTLLTSFCTSIYAADKVLAKVGDTALTEDQMRKDMGMQLYQAEKQLYTVQQTWIDQKAQNILFDKAAKDAGMKRAAWEASEIDAKVPVPDQGQVSQMAGNFIRPGVASTDTLRMATEYLTNQNKMMRRQQVYQELTKKYPVELMIVQPEAPRINVTYAPDDPVKGPANAAVTIVEFTDFQCPYCKRSQDTLKQIEQTYPKDVKLVARQYPLPFHNRAKPAAEAAMCAKEQGKFWQMRDKMFEKQALEEADIQRYVQEIGLNQKKFDQCVSSHKYAARIEGDIAEGQKFGVSGTPAFFVNGEFINGAQPFPVFQQAVQTALAKKK